MTDVKILRVLFCDGFADEIAHDGQLFVRGPEFGELAIPMTSLLWVLQLSLVHVSQMFDGLLCIWVLRHIQLIKLCSLGVFPGAVERRRVAEVGSRVVGINPIGGLELHQCRLVVEEGQVNRAKIQT
ncbi:MAG: hypothetical protein COW42_03975 [Deltaproteobacteria bacterium CG17_big_fil_post_rev_8_21_14_2_50_63_7]|nr:MAG: hypothetical protein COW42_03975 [Deltaproteobacteria bacterium CG17_big_fil_post_rev_8_21_14_2_50_63_7]